MKKSEHVLFAAEDEGEWSKQIVRAFPSTVFIDGYKWTTREPPTKLSISECGSNSVYIWNREIYPTLPVEKLVDETFRGPQAGMVIQFMRPTIQGSTLRSGDLGIGITLERPENEKMIEFAKTVLKQLHAMTSKRVVQVDPPAERCCVLEPIYWLAMMLANGAKRVLIGILCFTIVPTFI